jgi:hypothetical protein
VEARTEYQGTGISKALVAVVAVSITMALGVGAGVVAKNLSAPAAPQTHIVQGLGGAAQENPARRGGPQIAGGNTAPAAAVGPDDRPSTTKLAPAAPSLPVSANARGHRWI